jgi:ABC-type spermidine/putrescine transport system permease subunit I
LSDAALAPARRAAPVPSRDRLLRVVLVAPLVAWMLAFYALPVVAMLLRSVAEPTWTLENLIRLVTDNVSLRVFLITFRTAAVVTVCVALIGYPVAFALAQMRRSWANVLLLLVLLPFWTSVLVRTYAWMVLLGRTGVMNQFLLYLGAIDEPMRVLNTSLAVYIAMTHILLPYMILPTYSVLLEIDRALPRAAAGLGATPFAVLREVWLPLSMPGAAAGAMLVFVLSLGFFITPALVGGPRDLVVALLIQQQVDLVNWPFASALSAALLLVTLLVLAVGHRVLGLERVLRGGRR